MKRRVLGQLVIVVGAVNLVAALVLLTVFQGVRANRMIEWQRRTRSFWMTVCFNRLRMTPRATRLMTHGSIAGCCLIRKERKAEPVCSCLSCSLPKASHW